MPKFRIYGADEKTGEDTNILVNADTPDDAIAIARGRGIFTSRCVEIEYVQPPLPAKPTNKPPHKPTRRARGWGRGKEKYCPNCEQIVTPKMETQQAAGCLVFLLSIIVGLITFPFGLLLIIAGFFAMLLMGQSKFYCPKCHTPVKYLEKF